MKIRNGIAWLLCLLLVLPLSAAAVQPNTKPIVEDLIAYYFHHRDKASAEIGNQLEILSALDPEQGTKWAEIMTAWADTNTKMPLQIGVLPDGLPEDNSLCIVVLGYGLNQDGSMKEELLKRLEVAMASAEKYPQSYVLCTGGETAHVRGVSEAGQMGKFLLERGLDKDRLLLETDSLSTTENARNCCRLLRRDHPEVTALAIVSSDYHIPWGSILFHAEAVLEGMPLEVVGNAACKTDKANTDTMYSQAWGLSLLAGVDFDGSYVPPLYMNMAEETQPTEAQLSPLPANIPVQAEPPAEEPVIPVLLGLAAVMAIVFIPKKKSGSD